MSKIDIIYEYTVVMFVKSLDIAKKYIFFKFIKLVSIYDCEKSGHFESFVLINPKTILIVYVFIFIKTIFEEIREKQIYYLKIDFLNDFNRDERKILPKIYCSFTMHTTTKNVFFHITRHT